MTVLEDLTERCAYRLTPSDKSTIKAAARIQGCSPSEFSRKASITKARRVVRQDSMRKQKSASKAA